MYFPLDVLLSAELYYPCEQPFEDIRGYYQAYQGHDKKRGCHKNPELHRAAYEKTKGHGHSDCRDPAYPIQTLNDVHDLLPPSQDLKNTI